MKNNNKKAILILGADGMLGNAIFRYTKIKEFNVFGTSRKQ